MNWNGAIYKLLCKELRLEKTSEYCLLIPKKDLDRPAGKDWVY